MSDGAPKDAALREPVGTDAPRREIRRFLRGRGRYVADIVLPRMLHAAFVRSPHAHARIVSIDLAAARAAPGVERVFAGAELAEICAPLHGVALHRPGHKSALQPIMAVERAVWQGQPVVAVVARSRAEAEDAAERVAIEWERLPALVEAAAALAPAAPPIHPELGDNLAFAFEIEAGDADRAFQEAAVVVEQRFDFVRQTPMTLEPRGLIADYDPGSESLTVHHAHQSPFQMQDVFSRHLGLPEHKVRVIAPDVGGGFGMKLNVYGEELAVCAMSKLMGRPVKYLADRLESFVSDSHARDHRVTARMAVSKEGRITAMEVDDLAAVGAYGMPLRFNIAEGMMLITMAGAPYAFPNYRARTRNAYVNTNLIGMYRGVGIPLACVVGEALADLAAERLGIDPVEFRRRNYRRKESLSGATPGGVRLAGTSFDACLETLVRLMKYDELRRTQAEARRRGVYYGIGIATFVEATAYGPPYYGPSEARISTQDGCTVRLEPSGVVRCVTSITDQGQGTLTGLAQIVAATLGLALEDVEMIAGDSAISPYGGGAWASRGMAIGGEAALKAAQALRANILDLAATIAQTAPDRLDLRRGQIVNKDTGAAVISLADVGKIGYFRQDTLPRDFDVQLSATRSFVDNGAMCYMANGVQGSFVEVDPESGFVKCLGQWAVDDCGRVINPMQVTEQVRGGIVQGIGAVLFEECIYDPQGNFVNATMADYLVPMASEMPDIFVEHVETPERSTALGAKGIGEAGLIGAMGAVWVAVNDALKPFGARMTTQPFTPERVLEAIAAARRGTRAGK
ncbi:MAG TPA: xanthine dehydrogenase family protein molybdopterin-binding subunit [Alphaproteobacteria bacterium]|nr:xanthine dehydrogenase family protein molybdopterin-binding subunit [Alphaproteobacteria bacterium]